LRNSRNTSSNLPANWETAYAPDCDQDPVQQLLKNRKSRSYSTWINIATIQREKAPKISSLQAKSIVEPMFAVQKICSVNVSARTPMISKVEATQSTSTNDVKVAMHSQPGKN
jgi:hypothetical protein